MYKKAAIAIALVTLGGCSLDRGTPNWDNNGPDWALNCERNASVTSSDRKVCAAEAKDAAKGVAGFVGSPDPVMNN